MTGHPEVSELLPVCRPSTKYASVSAAANWKAFRDDPEWKSVKAKSEQNGKLVEKIDSTFLTLTDFSPRVG
ncbi:MAG TPA: NIPSNAP family protein [Candidatus Acidoferrales bacterium]|nr:NIPSNAP family protein [Candidatus Acidoferrales bacterium]